MTNTADEIVISDTDRIWTAAIGSYVCLTKPGGLPQCGIVDAKTPDGSVLWVISTLGERRLFHVSDGFSLVRLGSQ